MVLWDDISEVLVNSPTRLNSPPSARTRIRQLVSSCTDCSLHITGPNPPAMQIIQPSDFLVIGETSLIRREVYGWLDAALGDRFDIDACAHIGATQCIPYGRRGDVESPTDPQAARCLPHVHAAVAACSPRWTFLVGQRPLDIWLGQGWADTTQLRDETGGVVNVRGKSKGKRKISKVEVAARTENSVPISESEASGSIGVWEEFGSWVYVLPTPSRRVNVAKVVSGLRRLNPVLDGQEDMLGELSGLDLLSPLCVRCGGWVVSYASNGLGFCSNHWRE